ncbi:MAG: hypothetical protein HQ472_09685 [Ignavibacteria bacterium]|nr:hypothetical protein [Ignavibacteria bacterium]
MTSQVFPLVLTLLLQLISGIGLLAATKTRVAKSAVIPLSLLLGMFVHTAAMFALQLASIPLTLMSVLAAGLFGALLCNSLVKRTGEFISWWLKNLSLKINMYDLVAVGFAASVGYIVVWASWYWPVTPFDAMAGIDLVARQTVAEGSIVNRVFTDPSLAGHLSNQPFYAPFAMLMQVLYRLIGFEYGQVWLGIMSVSFSWFMYVLLRQYAHPFIANILWLLLILTPEMLGYTYLLQTDYLNAVFFASGVILLVMHLDTKENRTLLASALFFAAACWSRTETIALVGIVAVVVAPTLLKRFGRIETLKYLATTMVLCGVVFSLWHMLFFNAYLPVRPDSAAELTGFQFDRFTDVVSSTFSNVIFDKGLWGASFLLFAIVFIVDLVRTKKSNRTVLLAAIGAVFVGLILIGTLFTSAIVEQTLRRGMFKIIPLLFFYIASAPVIVMLSEKLKHWELSKKT